MDWRNSFIYSVAMTAIFLFNSIPPKTALSFYLNIAKENPHPPNGKIPGFLSIVHINIFYPLDKHSLFAIIKTRLYLSLIHI